MVSFTPDKEPMIVDAYRSAGIKSDVILIINNKEIFILFRKSHFYRDYSIFKFLIKNSDCELISNFQFFQIGKSLALTRPE